MSAASSIVILDTGPLGLVSNPKATPDNDACRLWLDNLVAQGRRVLVPEIADYETRRELLRANKPNGLLRLDRVKAALEYVPITTEAMLLAADMWAQTLTQGVATGDLAVATVNMGHSPVSSSPDVGRTFPDG